MRNELPKRLRKLLPLFEFTGSNGPDVTINILATYVFELLNANKDQEHQITWADYQEVLNNSDKMTALINDRRGQYYQRQSKDGENILIQKVMLGWKCSSTMIHNIFFLVKNIIGHHSNQDNKNKLGTKIDVLQHCCELYDSAFQQESFSINLYQKTPDKPKPTLTKSLTNYAKRQNPSTWTKIKTTLDKLAEQHIPTQDKFGRHIPISLRTIERKAPGHYLETVIRVGQDGRYYALIFNTESGIFMKISVWKKLRTYVRNTVEKINIKVKNILKKNSKSNQDTTDLKRLSKALYNTIDQLGNIAPTLPLKDLKSTTRLSSTNQTSSESPYHAISNIQIASIRNPQGLIIREKGFKVLPAVISFKSKESAVKYLKLMYQINAHVYDQATFNIILHIMIYQPWIISEMEGIHPLIPMSLRKICDKIKGELLDKDHLPHFLSKYLIPYEPQRVGSCVRSAFMAALHSRYPDQTNTLLELEKEQKMHHTEAHKKGSTPNSLHNVTQEYLPIETLHPRFFIAEKNAILKKIPKCSQLTPKMLYHKVLAQISAHNHIALNIFGAPYSGKTSLAEYIMAQLSKLSLQPLCLDANYLPENITDHPVPDIDDNLFHQTSYAFTAMLMGTKNPSPLSTLALQAKLSSEPQRNRMVFLLDGINKLTQDSPLFRWITYWTKNFNLIITSNTELNLSIEKAQVSPLTTAHKEHWIWSSALPWDKRLLLTETLEKSPFSNNPYGLQLQIEAIQNQQPTTEAYLLLSYITKKTPKYGPIVIIQTLKDLLHLTYLQRSAVDIRLLIPNIPGITANASMTAQHPIFNYLKEAKTARWVSINPDHTASITSLRIKAYIMALNYIDPKYWGLYQLAGIKNELGKDCYLNLFTPLVVQMFNDQNNKDNFLEKLLKTLPDDNPVHQASTLYNLSQQLPNEGLIKNMLEALKLKYGLITIDTVRPNNFTLLRPIPPHYDLFLIEQKKLPSYCLNKQKVTKKLGVVMKDLSEWLYFLPPTLSPHYQQLSKLRKKIFPTRWYPQHRRKTIDFHNLYVSSENAHAFYALLLVLDHNDYDKKLLPWLLIGLLNSNNVPFSQFPNQYHDAILLLNLDEPSKQALNKILICAIQTLQNVCVKAYKKGYDYESEYILLHTLLNILIEYGFYNKQTLTLAFDLLTLAYIDDETKPNYNTQAKNYLRHAMLYFKHHPNSGILFKDYANRHYDKLVTNLVTGKPSGSAILVHQHLKDLLPLDYYQINEPKWKKTVLNYMKSVDSLKALISVQKQLIEMSYGDWIFNLNKYVIEHFYFDTFLNMLGTALDLQTARREFLRYNELKQIASMSLEYVLTIISNEIQMCQDKIETPWKRYRVDLIRMKRSIGPTQNKNPSKKTIEKHIRHMEAFNSLYLLISPASPLANHTLAFISPIRISWALHTDNSVLITTLVKECLARYTLDTFRQCRREITLSQLIQLTQSLARLNLTKQERLNISLFCLNVLIQSLQDEDIYEPQLTEDQCNTIYELLGKHLISETTTTFRKSLLALINMIIKPKRALDLLLSNPYILRLRHLIYRDIDQVVAQHDKPHLLNHARVKNVTLQTPEGPIKVDIPFTDRFLQSQPKPIIWEKNWIKNMMSIREHLNQSSLLSFKNRLTKWVLNTGKYAGVFKSAFIALLRIDPNTAYTALSCRYHKDPLKTCAFLVHTGIKFDKDNNLIEGAPVKPELYAEFVTMVTPK